MRDCWLKLIYFNTGRPHSFWLRSRDVWKLERLIEPERTAVCVRPGGGNDVYMVGESPEDIERMMSGGDR